MAEDTMSRLTELLSDGESLQQIAELAEMLRTGDIQGETAAEETLEEGGMPDLEMLAGLAGVAGVMQQSDAETELLMALRPHLGEEKQRRLDKAVKLMRLAAVFEAAKESGLINDLI